MRTSSYVRQPWRERTRAPATRHRSAATWAARIHSTRPLPRLPRCMRTRPNATMPLCLLLSKRGACKPKPACKANEERADRASAHGTLECRSLNTSLAKKHLVRLIRHGTTYITRNVVFQILHKRAAARESV